MSWNIKGKVIYQGADATGKVFQGAIENLPVRLYTATQQIFAWTDAKGEFEFTDHTATTPAVPNRMVTQIAGVVHIDLYDRLDPNNLPAPAIKGRPDTITAPPKLAKKNLPQIKLSQPTFYPAEIDLGTQPTGHWPIGEIAYVAQGSSVTGTIFFNQDGSGKAQNNPHLSGVEILLENSSGRTARAVTDAQGKFTFNDVETGVYRLKTQVELSAEKHISQTGNLALTSKLAPFAVGENTSLKPQDIAYATEGGDIFGIVFRDQDGNGKRVGYEPGIEKVSVALTDLQGNPVRQELTKSNGEFWFQKVTAGEYLLRFSQTTTFKGNELNLTTADTQQITVLSGEKSSASAVGYQPEIHALRGKVIFTDQQPVKGVIVSATDIDTGKELYAETNDKGEYFIDTKRSGKFDIKFPQTLAQSQDGELLSKKDLRVEVNSVQFVPDRIYRRPSGDAGVAATFVTQTPNSSLQEAVGDIASYMPTMQSADWPGGGGGGMTMGRSGAAPLGQLVSGALTEVLGRKLKTDDPKAFIASLDRSFTPVEVNSRTEYKWTPRTYAVMTELGGGLSGAQASIYHRAKVALDDALPLLDGLSALLPDFDPQETEAVRSIVHTEFEELVRELGIEGGPRVQRVDDLFRILGLQLDRLEEEFGFGDQTHVNTVEEEQNLTNYFVVRDYINGLQQAWKGAKGLRAQFTGDTKFLGTQLVLLARGLSVVAEQVNEAKLTMESVFLGPTERQTVRIKFPSKIIINGQEEDILLDSSEPLSSMLVSELLDWVERFATEEGPMLIQDGGRIGVSSIEQTLRQLQRYVLGAAQAKVSHIGFSRQRVRRSLEEMAAQLGEVAQLAAGVSLKK